MGDSSQNTPVVSWHGQDGGDHEKYLGPGKKGGCEETVQKIGQLRRKRRRAMGKMGKGKKKRGRGVEGEQDDGEGER